MRGLDVEWTQPLPSFPDSQAVVDYLADWLDRQRRNARWEASVDSLYRMDAVNFRAIVHQGPAYAWGDIRPPDSPTAQRWARQAGFRPRRFAAGRPLRPEDWTSIRDSLVLRAAEAGFPFAAVFLDSIAWQAPGQLSGKITVEPGQLIRVGELRAPEKVRVRTLFLERYLGLKPGEVYHHDRVQRLTSRLNQLPYLTVKGPPKISFQDSLAFFDLPLERRAASRFDFVIGVLPGGGANEGLLITGELNGELYNGLGQGERIAARFEQLRPQTQELALALDYPFLLNLPFGFEGELDLYRRDSSFLNLNWRLAATYLREGNDKLSFFWENRRTVVPGDVIEPDTPVTSLPDTLGVSRSFFGLRARRLRTDRRFSPRSGYAADVSVAAGFRRLLDVAENDTLAVRSTQLKVEGSFDAYFDPLAGTVFYFGLRGAALLGNTEVLPNEQYRIGGARILRGFNEQTIFARDYQLATAEFRLLLGGNAYLYTFVDAARVNARNRADPDIAIDYPVGFGAGVNFETRAGIFGLTFALGRNNTIALDIGQPKVHLGYVSVF
ncbi:MAG: BamA/TamA family outer membrane protein [Bacteroidota bacterium]